MSQDEVKMVAIEIDGKSMQVPAGTMLIDATDNCGADVPRFCYHPKLSVAANCRMCLVEVEKAPKPMPACATPVMDGMVVHTQSDLARRAQKGVMEFLLINHPLDCPICDQGGECELQDVAMGYGGDVSRFTEKKRVVSDKDIGPLIATDMTRCILCTRCVRFGAEVAGLRELGATGRGETTEIGTYIEKSISSELSGNIIDICPVGALTAKPSRFHARAWEVKQIKSIAAHDSFGTNVYIHVRRNKVIRVVPCDNEAINECWISDRDRFSYEGLYSDDRLAAPQAKTNDRWNALDWESALSETAARIKAAIESHGADQLGFLVSPNCTVEELVLAEKIASGLGCKNIDSRHRRVDYRDVATAPAFPSLGCSIEALQAQDSILIIGSNIRKDQPMLAHRLRKAFLAGATISDVNAIRYDYVFDTAERIITSPATMVAELAGIANAAVGSTAPSEYGSLINSANPTSAQQNIAQQLKDGNESILLLGAIADAHPDSSILRGLARVISTSTGSKLGFLPAASNSVGAALIGATGREGMSSVDMISDPRKAYVLIGLDPDCDFGDPAAAQAALASAEVVVSIAQYRSDVLDQLADIQLPIAAIAETDGTFVNCEGRWQSFTPSTVPYRDSKPGWKVLRVLANELGIANTEYDLATQVRDEAQGKCADIKADNMIAGGDHNPVLESTDFVRVGEVPIYAADALVRRAPSLQKTSDGDASRIRINSATASALGLASGDAATATQGGNSISLPVEIDDRVADACVVLASALSTTSSMSAAIAPITLTKEADA